MNVQFPRVLVVDDCRFVRARLVKDLRGFGYLVSTAADGVEALARISAEHFDYVLTDWKMPNLDGERLCRCIRSTISGDSYIYVIMMTAHSTVDVVAGMNAGADDFITKPIDVRELSARMLNGARILAMAKRLTDDATHDPLTGVLNRRTLMESVTSTAGIARRNGNPLSILMLDLDRFKQINDEHGHHMGDQVLVAVADVLKSSFRSNDLVFRYGGEEFLVILAGADEATAESCAERCRQRIQGLNNFTGLEVTVSCGIAQMEHIGLSGTELIERADKALWSAKESGRNQTVCFSRMEPVPGASA